MPHIIVEHTDLKSHSVDIKKLNKSLHDCLSMQESVALDAIKTRSIEVQNAFIGNGSEDSFVHITVLLLKGRTQELKETMAESMFNCAHSYLEKVSCRLSINIEELGVYRK